MYKIKFSENYFKLPLPMPFTAVLMQVVKVNYRELSKCFITYDTEYKNGAYELPKTDLILLLLLAKTDDYGLHIFTTIRRFTPGKWSFYKGLEGEEFEIAEVQEKPKKEKEG